MLKGWLNIFVSMEKYDLFWKYKDGLSYLGLVTCVTLTRWSDNSFLLANPSLSQDLNPGCRGTTS